MPSSILGELRAFLKDQLPAYLIPEQWVVLAALPVTPDGREIRRGLPAPPDLAAGDAPPAETARQLAALWSAALGLDDIRLDDDFFDLGGDSFTAAVVAQQLGGRLSLQDMFAHPTLGAQARRLAQTDQGLAK